MAAFTKDQVFEAISSTRMIPVFFNNDIGTSRKVLKACYDGGVRVFEFTNRGEGADTVFEALVEYARTLPGLVLGIGSISFGRDARKFIRLGANFVVGPQYVPAVMRRCRFRHIPYMPGCGSVSEVGRAQRAGCGICKIFPGDVLGPKFIKALKAPMPWSRIMVTGGVKPERENLEAWFKAGVDCVGMGSNLFPAETITSGDWNHITELCQATLETIRTL